MDLQPCRECGQEVPAESRFCPHCGAEVPAGTRDPETARIRKKSEAFGEGCMIQGIGCLGGIAMIAAIPILGWIIGPIFIIAMLAFGSRKATIYICGACGNPVASRDVKVCPACRIALAS